MWIADVGGKFHRDLLETSLIGKGVVSILLYVAFTPAKVGAQPPTPSNRICSTFFLSRLCCSHRKPARKLSSCHSCVVLTGNWREGFLLVTLFDRILPFSGTMQREAIW